MLESAYIVYSIILPILILAAVHISLIKLRLEFLHSAFLMICTTFLMPIISVISLFTLSKLSESSGAMLNYADSNIWIFLPGPIVGGIISIALLYNRERNG